MTTVQGGCGLLLLSRLCDVKCKLSYDYALHVFKPITSPKQNQAESVGASSILIFSLVRLKSVHISSDLSRFSSS
ncbi:hypothetical protein L1887_20072 [Cichorium endivia]|nr:hypothetical protein L1887_20072 [Cichorium endivia]